MIRSIAKTQNDERINKKAPSSSARETDNAITPWTLRSSKTNSSNSTAAESETPSHHLRKRRANVDYSLEQKRPRIDNSHDERAVAHPTNKPRGLGEIAVAFTNMILKSGNRVIDLKEYASTMNIPIRRLYDVINVMDGAGIVERMSIHNDDDNKSSLRTMYRWIAPGFHCKEQESTLLSNHKDELDFLDTWIDCLTKKQHYQDLHITSTDLVNLFKDSTLLPIVNTNMSHVGNLQQYSLVLAVPPPKFHGKTQLLPEAFLLNNVNHLQVVTFPSTLLPFNINNGKENHPVTNNNNNKTTDSLLDYSPLKKLLSVIPTHDETKHFITPSPAAAQEMSSPSRRHPLDVLASVIHSNSTNNNTT